MKPAPFAYCRPQSLDEVIAVLGEHGDEAKVLAGGQSLVPMLNFRLARPAVLVDLQRVEGLDEISVTGRTLSIGAMARQARVARSAVVAARAAILPEALRHVGHHQIRTRGTVGGSLAHADPAAELPAVALLLEAEIEAQGPDGPRRISAAAFFEGPYSTSLADDEVLTAVHVPSLEWMPVVRGACPTRRRLRGRRTRGRSDRRRHTTGRLRRRLGPRPPVGSGGCTPGRA